LAELFPALFSHVTRPHASVAAIVASGLSLQPRLSTAAAADLVMVNRVISTITLRDGVDGRALDSTTAPAFSSRAAYRALSPARALDASACIAWGSRLPTKLKIFVYLADIDRLSSRANLFFKNCAQTDQCAACSAVKTGRHLLFECPTAAGVWALAGSQPPSPGSSCWAMSLHMEVC
jgi:hypothetical protein